MTKATRECLLKIRDLLASEGWSGGTQEVIDTDEALWRSVSTAASRRVLAATTPDERAASLRIAYAVSELAYGNAPEPTA